MVLPYLLTLIWLNELNLECGYVACNQCLANMSYKSLWPAHQTCNKDRLRKKKKKKGKYLCGIIVKNLVSQIITRKVSLFLTGCIHTCLTLPDYT